MSLIVNIESLGKSDVDMFYFLWNINANLNFHLDMIYLSRMCDDLVPSREAQTL